MIRRRMPAAILALALGLCAACSAEPRPAAPPASDPLRTAAIAAAKTLIARVPFATLITLDAAGAPQARIVEPFPLEDEFVIWIATTGASRKVAEIARDPRVSLSYFDAAAPGYVTLAGTATIVRDPAEKAKRWKDSWVGFYKDRNRGDDYTLIRIAASRLEISSPSQGMNNDPATWTPVIVQLR